MGHSWTKGARGVSAKIDLAGQRFGRWTVLEEGGRDERGRALWRCRCDCGTEREVKGWRLREGTNRSCGCLRRETSAALGREMATHGMSQTRIYNTWKNMIQRTTDPKAASYPHYGGRGIKVCERWQSLDGFLADMGPTYADDLTIERIHVDGDYEPGNCRWVTAAEQARNKRNTRLLEFRGRSLIIADWAEVIGLNAKTLTSRIYQYGWPVERALTEGVSPERLASLQPIHER